MTDSDQRPDSNWCPLLKSASTDVNTSNYGPIQGYYKKKKIGYTSGTSLDVDLRKLETVIDL